MSKTRKCKWKKHGKTSGAFRPSCSDHYHKYSGAENFIYCPWCGGKLLREDSGND